MKNVFLTLLFLIPFIGISQDIIEKINGAKIHCKVLRIDETNVEYKLKNTEDEPMRSIKISSVKRITYGNGTIEEFSIENSQFDRNGRKKKDPILKSGFYLDGLIGIVSGPRQYSENFSTIDPSTGFISTVYVSKYRTETFASNGMRIGNKWYFGMNEKRRFGINATWLRFSTLMSSDAGLIEDIHIAPLSIGFASIFKFKEKMGVEINTYTGTGMFMNNGTSELSLGLNAKYRYGSFALGLDYSYSMPIGNTSYYIPHSHLFNLSIGMKF